MHNIIAVILAAGKGTRMKSAVPKVLHKILGKPIISYILDSVKGAGISYTITIAGHGNALLAKAVKDTKILIQKDLTGSASAVMASRKFLGQYSGDVLIMCGDTPLVRSDTIKSLMNKHKSSRASLTILTAELKNPTGYGRIIRDSGRKIVRILEEEEAEVFQKAITEVNVGTYCFKAKDMFDALAAVRADNKKKEFFLTDAVAILHKKSRPVESVTLKDSGEMIGINARKDLAEAARILKHRVLDDVMSNGVTVEDPESTIVYPGVKIKPDTVIRPNTLIESDVEIGKDCRIGPFARLRGGVRIGNNVEVGNFVELVRTSVGNDSKIKHHTYLGDTTVGRKVNVGAGTITANFDGKKKSETVIGDGAFIGVGAILIAPVKIGKSAVVGAGSVVPKNHNVPKGSTVVGVPARIIVKGIKT